MREELQGKMLLELNAAELQELIESKEIFILEGDYNQQIPCRVIDFDWFAKEREEDGNVCIASITLWMFQFGHIEMRKLGGLGVSSLELGYEIRPVEEVLHTHATVLAKFKEALRA